MGPSTGLHAHWWRFGLRWWCFVFITASLMHFTAADKLNWCVVGDGELSMCNRLIKYLNRLDESTWGCVKGTYVDDCITLIENGEADFAMLDAAKAYMAYQFHGLTAVMSQIWGTSNRTNGAVAVVKKELCNGTDPMFPYRLRGKVSCHTGYRDLAGWYVPIGIMLDNGAMPPVSVLPEVSNDVESAQAFFSRSCAPGKLGSRICSACSAQDCMPLEEKYVGDGGALSCLVNGGEVAFVRNGTVMKYALGGSSPSIDQPPSDFMHLCLDGTCQMVDDANTCMWMTIPEDMIVTRLSLADKVRKKTVEVLTQLSQMPEFQNDFFSPSQNPKDLIFSSGTSSLLAVTDYTEVVMGKVVLHAIDTVNSLDLMPINGGALENGSSMTWCAAGSELQLCQQLTEQLNSLNQQTNISWNCYSEPQFTKKDCLLAVQSGTADLVSGPAATVFEGAHFHGLSAIMSEECNDSSTGDYHAIAIIRKEFCNQNPGLTFADLKGKRSCHGGGYGDPGGWIAPLAFMVNEELVEISDDKGSRAKDVLAASGFFSTICAPNASVPELCSGCQERCSADATPFDDASAMNCLVTNAADVAFIRHPKNVLNNPEPYGNIDQLQFSLLCPAGGCADLSQADACHFYSVPFPAVMTRSAMASNIILKIATSLQNASTTTGFQAIFGNNTNSQSLLFSKSLVALSPITATTDEYLGASVDMFATYAQFSGPPAASVRPAGRRNYVLKVFVGILIAIAICCVIAASAYGYFKFRKMSEVLQRRKRAKEYTRPDF